MKGLINRLWMGIGSGFAGFSRDSPELTWCWFVSSNIRSFTRNPGTSVDLASPTYHVISYLPV